MKNNIVQKTYTYKDILVDIIVENLGNGHINTDVWIKAPGQDVKTLFIFDLEDMTIDDVISVTNKAIDNGDVH